ncbi:hypothetical protein FKW77_007329 [Venturia effusa]|uniref:F-box domain-containing protein n=1 Tax=Venturia effusa TaxID=50376 RepID=A0A517L3P2_9PEZI|nr:hypothetical protein FKW77_007329 [Venturia effusa]
MEGIRPAQAIEVRWSHVFAVDMKVVENDPLGSRRVMRVEGKGCRGEEEKKAPTRIEVALTVNTTANPLVPRLARAFSPSVPVEHHEHEHKVPPTPTSLITNLHTLHLICLTPTTAMADDDTHLDSYFLKLPIELRRNIYSLLLPSTMKESSPQKQTGTLWRRGCISLLQVSRIIYEECADMLYGTNTIEIDIKYDGIKFRFSWLTRSGLKPKILYPFPAERFRRNVKRMRHFVINVEHVDSYQGMIKYNCGGPGLTAGVKSQVRAFVQHVQTLKALGRIIIRLSNGDKVLSDIRRVKVYCVEREKNTKVTQSVLDPFRNLNGVRRAEVMGSVTPEYAAAIEQAMTAQGTTASHMSPDGKSEESSLDPAVLWRWKHCWNA